jgi:hypothetical protein
MPTRAQTILDAVQLFANSVYPGGIVAPEHAWLGIYQVLLWYEPVGVAGFTSLPHIIDADKLRPSKYKNAQAAAKGTPLSHDAKVWQNRADAVQNHIAAQLSLQPDQVEPLVDLLLKSTSYLGLQRHNPLGTAFPGLVRHVLQLFGNPSINYELEMDARQIFPGIAMAGRSTKPSIDILALKDGKPRAIISAKWSVRHDRVGDITNECPIYKAAAIRMRLPLDYYVVTNEFDPARLDKMLTDTCINGLVHVHKENVITVAKMNGRLSGMLDLVDLLALTNAWAVR